ncbi:substrate-binding periplasmic protein [Shewanella woodyi]|uniref:substrate-binding periplasmic protein n=1 Tax=Shewanella woodyi TaxID=60961 RepID=UPI0007F8AEB4|nr:transporter substrate-binding domain-containing protein [Shewanella woodyi]
MGRCFKSGFFSIFLSLLLICQSIADESVELRLLTEPWAPVSYDDAGIASGFAVELVNELQRIMGTELEIEVLPWARALSIANSLPNVVLFATSVDEERRKNFDFIGPIITSKISLYAKANDHIEINSLEELNHAGSIGTYRSAIGLEMLKELGLTQLLVSSFPHQSAKQLIKGRVRFWCQADIAVASLLTKIGANIDSVKPVFVLSEIELYLAFSKGTELEVIKQWQRALAYYKTSGKFKRLYYKWFGDLPVPERVELIRRVE